MTQLTNGRLNEWMNARTTEWTNVTRERRSKLLTAVELKREEVRVRSRLRQHSKPANQTLSDCLAILTHGLNTGWTRQSLNEYTKKPCGEPNILNSWRLTENQNTQNRLTLSALLRDGFFLSCEDFGRMFDYSFPACTFFFFLTWRLARAH